MLGRQTTFVTPARTDTYKMTRPELTGDPSANDGGPDIQESNTLMTAEDMTCSLSYMPRSFNSCPDCGAHLARAEGCARCYSCGYSECG